MVRRITIAMPIRMLALGVCLLSVEANAADAVRPNILLFFSDDTPQRDYGCYGNDVVQTPNIDRLASQGMRLINMFTPSPTCAPSRAVLYTGLYPIRNGAHANHSAVKPGTRSIAHYLAHLGYRVVVIGKRHEAPPESFPFEYFAGNLDALLAEPGEKPLCVILTKLGSHVAWPENTYGYDPARMKVPPHLVDTPETREAMTRYYSAITVTDEAVGEVMDLLEQRQMAGNTVLMFTADHGTDWPREKHNLDDTGIQTPFIVRWPGKIEPGSYSDALLTYADIVPTFIDIAGGDAANVVAECGGQELDGVSCLPVLLGRQRELHETVYGVYTWGVMQAYPMRSARTRDFKYIRNLDSRFRYNWPVDTGWWGDQGGPMAFTQWSRENWPIWKSWLDKAKVDPKVDAYLNSLQYRAPEELYDLRSDPDEMQNLTDDPDYTDALADMRQRLDAWMRQQGDDGSSAYHGEADSSEKFLDQFYSRQKVVNARLYPLNLHDRARVELLCPLWQAPIRYTLDGSEPTVDSPLYEGPFNVSPPVTIKARAFYDGGQTPVRAVEFPAVDFRLHYKYHFKPESF